MLAIDRSKDWQYFDAPLTVGYRVKTGPGAWAASVNVDHVQCQKIDSTADAELWSRSTTYTLWRDRMSAAGLTAPPKRDDKLSEGGFDYDILAVEHCDLDKSGLAQRFRCLTVQVSK